MAGFIVSHLVDRLAGEVQDVLVIDDLSTGVRENLRAGPRFEHRDVATANIGHLFATWRPEVFYHLAAQALGDGVLRVNGDGQQMRDFVHVQDVVEALCLVARPMTGDETWNVATGTRVSIAELVEAAIGRRLAHWVAPRRPGDVIASSL